MPEDTEVQAEASPRRRGRAVPILIVALLMGAEGVGIFIAAKVVGSDPASAMADGGDAGSVAVAGSGGAYAELELADCRPSNGLSGKFVTFHIRVTALIASADLERAQRLVRAKRAQLEDGVNTVIRSTAPKHFDEPSYDTVKRRLKSELGRIFGDEELIKELVIPQMHQSGPGV